MTVTGGKRVAGRVDSRASKLVARLKSCSAAVWFGNFGSVGLRFAQNILIARLVGADQMGIYVAVIALTLIIGRITDLGLPNSLVYFARAHKSAIRRCVMVCIGHSLFMVPAAIALLRLATPLGLTNDDAGEVIAGAWPILATLATTQLLNQFLSQLLISLDGYRSYGAAMMISPLVAMGVCLFLSHGLNATGLAIAMLSGESCAALVAFGLVMRGMPRGRPLEPPPTLAAIYVYALKTYVGTSMKVLGQRGDRIILSWFLPNSLLAAYAVAVSLRDNASLPITTHSMLLRNILIDKEKGPGGPVTAATFLRGELLKWTLISAGIAAALAISSPLLVPLLYGDQFRSAVTIFAFLAASLPFIAIATLCWTGMLSAAKPGLVSFGLILGGAANLAALYAGARPGGVTGAAWGSLVASIAVAAWWLIATFRGSTYAGTSETASDAMDSPAPSFSRYVANSLAKLAKDPRKIVRFFDKRYWIHTYWIARFGAKSDLHESRWNFLGDIGHRRYQSYEGYKQHQASKIDDPTFRKKLEGLEEEQFQGFLRRFRLAPEISDKHNVLCLGARLGTEVRALKALGHFAVGIDLNPGRDNPHVHAGDFHNLAFADNSVDAVYTNVLDHAFDLGKVMGEVARVLRPGGIAFLEIIKGTEEGYLPAEYEAIAWKTARTFAAELAKISGLRLLAFRTAAEINDPYWNQAIYVKA